MLLPKSNYAVVTAAAAMLLASAALADTKADDRSYLPPQELQAPKQELQAPKKYATNRRARFYPRTAHIRVPPAKSYRHVVHYRTPYLRRRPHYVHRRARRAARRYYASPGFFPGSFFGLFP
jgi:hypothetical protein